MENDPNCRIDSGNYNGFTLLEVLIAMTVGGIGLLGLALMQGNAVKANSVGSRYTRAVFLAQDTLEQIKDGNSVADGTYGFIDMPTHVPDTAIDSGSVYGVTESGMPGGPFDVQWQVSTHTNWSRKIDVVVSWVGTIGRIRTVELVSASRGGGN